jgi:putative hydroxymethylpyrimidine transport system permease protein
MTWMRIIGMRMSRTRAIGARDGVLAFADVLLAWQALVWLTAVPPLILPGPVRVAETLFGQHRLILDHAGITIAEVLIGIALGTLLGALTALHLTMSRTARRCLLPVLVFS